MSESFDLYSDGNEPEAHFVYTTYIVRLSRNANRKSDEMAFVYVEVDQYGLLNLNEYRTIWFDDKLTHVDAGRSVHELRKQIYDWLVEWEFAEWKRIGPEDSELFATAKLIGDKEYARLDM
jgi:hypothetical protein